MSETPSTFRKISDSKYEIILNNETVPIHVPFAKAQLVFETMLQSGIDIDSEGQVKLDPIAVTRSLRVVGDLLLTKFNDKGEEVEEGNCAKYEVKEVKALFDVAVNIFLGFTEAVFADQTPVEQGSGKAKKKTTSQ